MWERFVTAIKIDINPLNHFTGITQPAGLYNHID